VRQNGGCKTQPSGGLAMIAAMPVASFTYSNVLMISGGFILFRLFAGSARNP
jgi:hypothetical protein